MYLGRIVELAPKEELFSRPSHPYTIALLESAPVFGRRAADIAEPAPDEDVGEEERQTTGCRYRARCRAALPECAVTEPALQLTADGHSVACHLFNATREE
jgi:oligopeptide/dipeptide ABC transporter ATP-binding protein